jgi:hypothetical protein
MIWYVDEVVTVIIVDDGIRAVIDRCIIIIIVLLL